MTGDHEHHEDHDKLDDHEVINVKSSYENENWKRSPWPCLWIISSKNSALMQSACCLFADSSSRWQSSFPRWRWKVVRRKRVNRSFQIFSEKFTWGPFHWRVSNISICLTFQHYDVRCLSPDWSLGPEVPKHQRPLIVTNSNWKHHTGLLHKKTPMNKIRVCWKKLSCTILSGGTVCQFFKLSVASHRWAALVQIENPPLPL